MTKIFNGASVMFGAIGGFAAWLLGGWDTTLKVLLAVMALDYVTGLIKAVYTKTMSSKTGFKGLLKKLIILAVVALANVIGQLVGENIAVREVVIMFYIANEGISILENAAEIMPNMPQKLKDVLLQLRNEKGGDTKNDGD